MSARPFKLPLLLLLVLLFQLQAGTGFAAEGPKRVLILDSFGGVPPFSTVVSALREELHQRWPGAIDIYEISLEAARAAQPENEESTAESIANRLTGNTVDLVIPVGIPACRFAAHHRERLFPHAPTILTCLDPRRVTPDLITPHTVMVTNQGNPAILVAGILELLPKTRRICVILGATPIEGFWKQYCQEELAQYSDRVEFEWWDDASLNVMKQRVTKLPPDTVVFYGLLVRDAAGVVVNHEIALREIATASNAPVVGYYESQMGLGIIGGKLLPDKLLGRSVAAAATRILDGEDVSAIETIKLGAQMPIYDWRELERFGIPESQLPRGSRVLFRPRSLWEAYRWQLIALGGVMLLQLLLIAGLLAQARRRARAERALAANEKRLQLITDTLPVLIAYVDRDRRYQFNNKAFQSWFGLTPETARGKTAKEVLGERLYQMVRPFSERALAGEQVNFTADTTLDNGRVLAVDGIYVPDRDEHGAVRGFYALVMDVTERNQAWRAAGQLRDELAHAGRVSLMGVLAAALAHELNQPLAAIMNNAQAARRFLKAPSPNLGEIGEILADIVSDDERASQVIRRLRALVKKEPSDFTYLDVADVINGVEKLVHNDALMRHCSLILDVQPELPRIHGDRIQLQQVLLNLILNAFEAVEANPISERTVNITARQDERGLLIAVRDRGEGISEDQYEGLFEPFQTSKKQGLGMGLSISRSIAELHGGQLWGENNPEIGATFYLVLPIPSNATLPHATLSDGRHASPLADSLRGG